MVLEVVLGGGAELAAGVQGVLELDFVVVEKKLAGVFVAVFGSAFHGLLGPAAELHGAEGCAADAGLEGGWGFGDGLKRGEEGGVEGVERGDDEAADGFGGEFGGAWDFALGFEAVFGGFEVEILVSGGSVGGIVEEADGFLVEFLG